MPSCLWKNVLCSMFLKLLSCDTHISGPLKCAKSPISKISCVYCNFVTIFLKHSLLHLWAFLFSFILVKPIQQLAKSTLYPFFVTVKIFSSIYTHNHLLVIHWSGQSVFWNCNVWYNSSASSTLYNLQVCSFPNICVTFLVDGEDWHLARTSH